MGIKLDSYQGSVHYHVNMNTTINLTEPADSSPHLYSVLL